VVVPTNRALGVDTTAESDFRASVPNNRALTHESRDERAVLRVPGVDTAEVYRWLDQLIGADDPRRERLRQKERELLGA
jgi:hypothetical protein